MKSKHIIIAGIVAIIICVVAVSIISYFSNSKNEPENSNNDVEQKTADVSIIDESDKNSDLTNADAVIIDESDKDSELLQLNLRDMVENENIEDLSLEIYYAPHPYIYKLATWTADNLKSQGSVVLRQQELIDVLPVLYNLDVSEIVKTGFDTRMDAFICYTLNSSKNGKLLEVVFWNVGVNCAYVNGVPVYNNDVLYEILHETLPRDVWDKYVENNMIKVSW